MSQNPLLARYSWFNETAVVCLAFLLVGTGSGCRFSSTPPASQTRASRQQSTPAQAKNQQAKSRLTGQSSQQPPDWTKVVNAWWQVVSSPSSTSTKAVAKPPRRVAINVSAIAARHPAWALAQALERDRSTPITLTPVMIEALQQAAAPEAFVVPAVDEALGANKALSFTDPPAPIGRRPTNRNWTPGTVAGLDLPERRLIADELQVLQQDARVQQINAFNEFLRDVQVRQDAARNEQATLLQLGLQYDIEAAQRSSLSRLVPILPPEEVQLELTNLRLQLLKNLYTTEAERDAARRRLEELEAQWTAQLRRQEEERLAELRRILTEIPARVRREGEAQISTYKEAARQRDAAFRQSVEEAQQSRAAQDFGPSTTRLGIVLPASVLPSQSLTNQSGAEPTIIGGDAIRGSASIGSSVLDISQLKSADRRLANISRTFSSGLSSLSGSAAQLTSSSFPRALVPSVANTSSQIQQRRVILIGALRALALRDARRWARMVARRSGWEWREGAVVPVSHVRDNRPEHDVMKVTPVRDVTQEVLQDLKLG